MALISLAIAGDARSHREARLHPMVTALTFSFALRWASFYAANQIDTNPFYIGVLYAIPVVAGVAASGFLNMHKRLSIPAAVGERAAGIWHRIERLTAFCARKDARRQRMIFGTSGTLLLAATLRSTIWFFLGIISIVFLIDFSETAGRMSGLPGYTVAGGLLMTAVRLPLIIQQTVPFIALFVGMTVLIGLNRKYELVVARAAGISVWQFMSPFIAGAFLLGILTMAVINPLAAWGQRQAALVETDWRGQEKATSSKPQVPWLRQISGKDDVIIGARTIQQNGTLLIDAVLIHFDSDGRVILRQDAASAKLEDGYWLLKNVTERRPGRNRGPQGYGPASHQFETRLRPGAPDIA